MPGAHIGSEHWWTLPKPRPGAAVRLFCLPYAGGNAALFRNWHASLPPDVEVYGVQLPGRANRIMEPPRTRLPDLVAEIARALGPLLDKAFVVFGHSLGAILAFEVTRYLRRQGGPLPLHLFVSGARALHLPLNRRHLHDLADRELIASMAALNGTPPEVLEQEELLQLMLPTLRADFELADTYEYVDAEPLPCSITAFGGVKDPSTSHGRLSAWRGHTTRAFAEHVLDGDHFFINTHTAELLALLHADLVRVCASLSPGMCTAR